MGHLPQGTHPVPKTQAIVPDVAQERTDKVTSCQWDQKEYSRGGAPTQTVWVRRKENNIPWVSDQVSAALVVPKPKHRRKLSRRARIESVHDGLVFHLARHECVSFPLKLLACSIRGLWVMIELLVVVIPLQAAETRDLHRVPKVVRHWLSQPVELCPALARLFGPRSIDVDQDLESI